MSRVKSAEIEWIPILATWLSPTYPVGGYAYSHGLEWGVATGRVTDRETLQDYVATALEQGGGWTDLILLAEAWRIAANTSALLELAEFGRALRPSAELSLESGQQGGAFAAATRAAWPGSPLDAVSLEDTRGFPYPVAIGAACSHCVPLNAALTAYAHAFCCNLVSAGMRLIPLGQTNGQRAIAALSATALEVAERAERASLDDLGSAAPLIEIGSMRHETQYTRLFRS